MQSGSNHAMNFLQPKLSLIGSIPEGTRIGEVIEMDVTMQFEGLKKFPFDIRNENAMKLFIDDPDHPLIDFVTVMGNGEFDFNRFFGELHQHIKEALLKIKNKFSKGLRIGNDKLFSFLSFSSSSKKFCYNCLKLKDENQVYSPFKHCTKCLFPVTHTKIGPCLIFEWKHHIFSASVALTVDLVPIYPIKSEGRKNMMFPFKYQTRANLGMSYRK